MDITTH